jgi:hypothetical protein
MYPPPPPAAAAAAAACIELIKFYLIYEVPEMGEI